MTDNIDKKGTWHQVEIKTAKNILENPEKIWEQYLTLGKTLEKLGRPILRSEVSIYYRKLFGNNPSDTEFVTNMICVTFLINNFKGTIESKEDIITLAQNIAGQEEKENGETISTTENTNDSGVHVTIVETIKQFEKDVSRQITSGKKYPTIKKATPPNKHDDDYTGCPEKKLASNE